MTQFKIKKILNKFKVFSNKPYLLLMKIIKNYKWLKEPLISLVKLNKLINQSFTMIIKHRIHIK